MEQNIALALAQNLEPLLLKKVHASGPVITLSREYGCQANALAEQLQSALKQKNQSWRYLSKESLKTAGKQLLEEASALGVSIDSHQENTLEQMLNSLENPHSPEYSRYHRRTQDIIASFAKEGWAIIVGRAGVVLSQENPQALHIRLVAPIEWRAQMLHERRNIDVDDAQGMAFGRDHQRQRFLAQIHGDEVKSSHYDLILNRKTLSSEEILEIILNTLEIKKLL